MIAKFVLNNDEYQKLRYEGMTGMFEHELSRDNKDNVRIKTRRPQQLVKDLERVLGSGETSWHEILDIKPVL